jgi:hypothetical protein
MTELTENAVELDESERDGMSRRGVLLGLGAAAGAAAGASLLVGQHASAAAPASVHSLSALAGAAPRPQAVGAQIPGLQYLAIDAQGFFPSDPKDKLYQDLTGTEGFNAVPSRDVIWYSLPLPAGTQIHQINVGYQAGAPVVHINRRPLTQTAPAAAPTAVFTKTLDTNPGGPGSTTVNLTTPVTILPDASYTISFDLDPGESIFNAQIGYLPPYQSFIPFTGSAPRVLDTREPGPLTGKLKIDEERTVDLGVSGARSAVINLTVTQTSASGYVAVFPANIAWPGNSSINWTSANTDIANAVITAVDPTGKIKIRGGGGANTHVVIDRVGFMV